MSWSPFEYKSVSTVDRSCANCRFYQAGMPGCCKKHSMQPAVELSDMLFTLPYMCCGSHKFAIKRTAIKSGSIQSAPRQRKVVSDGHL